MTACSPLRGVGGILRIATVVLGVVIIGVCFGWTSLTGSHGRYSFPVVPWFLFSCVMLILLMVDCCPGPAKLQTDWLGHFLGGAAILIQESLLCIDLERCTGVVDEKGNKVCIKPQTEEYVFLVLGFAQGLLYLVVGYFSLRGPPEPKVEQTPERQPSPPKHSSAQAETFATLATPRA